MAATSGGVKAGKAFVLIQAVDKTATVLQGISRKMKAWATKMSSIGRGMVTKALGAAIPAALAVKTFTSFDDVMRRVKARTGATGAEFQALRNQAKELGRTTSFTATQVGALQEVLGQKGFDVGQIQAVTPTALNLAKAAGSGDEGDAALSADLISGSLRAFGEGTDQAERFADVFTTAVNNSNFSLESLSDGMKKAAPLARDYGLSVEETAAMLASMTNLNIEASEAGTAFTSFLARMSKEEFTGSFNKKLEAMTGSTIQFKDAAGNLRKPMNIMSDIGKAVDGMGSAEKGDLLSSLFGVRQFGKATGSIRGSADALELLDKLNTQARGSAKKTAEEMESGIGGSFRKFMSAVEGVAIALGEALAPALQTAATWLTENLGPITEWIEKHKGIIVTVAGVTVGLFALGAALMAGGMLVSVLGSALSAVAVVLGLVKGALLFLVSPVGIVIAAIAAVVAILYTFSSSFREVVDNIVGFVSEKFSAMAGTIVDTFKGVMSAIGQGNFTAAWEIAVAGLETVWAQFTDMLHTGWENFTSFFVEAWIGAVATVQTAVLKLQKTIAKGLLESASEGNAISKLLFIGSGVDPEEARKLSEKLEAQRRARGLKGQATGYEQAQQDLTESFDAKMAKAQENAAKAMEDHQRAVADARGERETEVAQRKAKLQELLDGMDQRKDAEDGLAEGLGAGMDKAKADLETAMAGLTGGGGPLLSPEVKTGLAKGSLEAAQAFFQNRENTSMASKQLGAAEKAAGHLESIDAALNMDAAGANINVA